MGQAAFRVFNSSFIISEQVYTVRGIGAGTRPARALGKGDRGIAMAATVCEKCGADETGVWRLIKCPMCYKYVCENCATRIYGRLFCSNRCGTNFFLHYDDETYA
jgi:hypothetical protein